MVWRSVDLQLWRPTTLQLGPTRAGTTSGSGGEKYQQLTQLYLHSRINMPETYPYYYDACKGEAGDMPNRQTLAMQEEHTASRQSATPTATPAAAAVVYCTRLNLTLSCLCLWECSRLNLTPLCCSGSHLHEHHGDGASLEDVREGEEGDVPVLGAQGHARASNDDGVGAGVGHHAGVSEHDALGVALHRLE